MVVGMDMAVQPLATVIVMRENTNLINVMDGKFITGMMVEFMTAKKRKINVTGAVRSIGQTASCTRVNSLIDKGKDTANISFQTVAITKDHGKMDSTTDSVSAREKMVRHIAVNGKMVRRTVPV